MSTEFHEGVVTIMFTDVEGSTDLTARHGDEAAQRIIDLQRRVVREEVDRHGGREGDSIGDGFMITFPSTRRAVLCAIAIQQTLKEHGEQHPDERVRLRIGLNVGEVISQAGHPFGGAVNAAARVAGQAKSGEILVAEAVRQVAGTMPGVATRDRGRFQLKGFPERWRLYEVIWEPGVDGAGEPEGAGGRLRLPTRRLHRVGLAILAALLLGGVAAGAVLTLTGTGDGERAGKGGSGDGSQLPAAVSDPPEILPGRSIGGIRLGMSEDEAIELYGEPELRRDWTSGGKTFALFSYNLHAGRFRVATFDGKVVSISTESPYYELEDGTAAGEITPGPLGEGVVERDKRYFWNEFEYEDFGQGCNAWTARGFNAATELVLSSHFSGRIEGVRIVALDHVVEVPREIGACR